MNERIKELAELADDYADEYIQMPGEYHPDWNTVRDIRFAELIIKDCVNACEKNSWTTLDAFQRSAQIKEHFGVEE